MLSIKRLLAAGLLFAAGTLHAQDIPNKKALDSVDKSILQSIIYPAEPPGQVPDWAAIRVRVSASYSDVQTDRAITKAQIYYYYSKDWPKFSTAIVHYTEAYEDKEDYKLMNKNAKMILDHSQDPKEWKIALGWVQHAVDKEPDDAGYKQTRDALQAKLAGQ